MNDRFKFRVWFAPDWQNPEMIYEAEHTYDNRCRNKGSFHHDSFGEILEDKDCIVMQCTGLKDKNGKLIYEGDIVKLDDELNCIAQLHNKYDIDYGRIEFILIGGHPKCPTIYIPTVANESEVIGNIYENKELLNA